MTKAEEYRKGDWVGFWDGSTTVIAEVQYIREDSCYPYGYQAVTALGFVDVKNILEHRKVQKPTTGGEGE